MAELKKSAMAAGGSSAGHDQGKAISRWNETTVPPLKDGTSGWCAILRSRFESHAARMDVDGHLHAGRFPLGQTMKAGTVGQVSRIEASRIRQGRSRARGFSDGKTTTVNGGEGLIGIAEAAARKPIQYWRLSLLGTTGLTAFFGTLAVGAVKVGRLLSSSRGAAGANRFRVRDDPRRIKRMPRSWYRGRSREIATGC